MTNAQLGQGLLLGLVICVLALIAFDGRKAPYDHGGTGVTCFDPQSNDPPPATDGVLYTRRSGHRGYVDAVNEHLARWRPQGLPPTLRLRHPDSRHWA